MDEAISQLLNLGTAVLAISIVIATFFVRRGVELAWPSLRKKADENESAITYSTSLARWYQQVILYAIPVVIGMVLGFIDIPFLVPEAIRTAKGGVFYGAVCGWLSSAFYKIFKRILAQKTGIELPSLRPSGVPSTPPPPKP